MAKFEHDITLRVDDEGFPRLMAFIEDYVLENGGVSVSVESVKDRTAPNPDLVSFVDGSPIISGHKLDTRAAAQGLAKKNLPMMGQVIEFMRHTAFDTINTFDHSAYINEHGHLTPFGLEKLMEDYVAPKEGGTVVNYKQESIWSHSHRTIGFFLEGCLNDLYI